MKTDEHGMPLPDNRLLPLSLNEDGEVIDSYGEEAELWCDPEFFVHAANHIIECRDIVRRLAENEEKTLDQWVCLYEDAKELWAKMREGAVNK